MMHDPFGMTEKYDGLCQRLDRQNELLGQLVQREAHPARATEKVPRTQTYSFRYATAGWFEVIPPNPNIIAVTMIILRVLDTETVTFGQGESVQTAHEFPAIGAGVGAGGTLPFATTGLGLEIACGWPSCLMETYPGLGFYMSLGTGVRTDGYVSYYLLDRQQAAA